MGHGAIIDCGNINVLLWADQWHDRGNEISYVNSVPCGSPADSLEFASSDIFATEERSSCWCHHHPGPLSNVLSGLNFFLEMGIVGSYSLIE